MREYKSLTLSWQPELLARVVKGCGFWA